MIIFIVFYNFLSFQFIFSDLLIEYALDDEHAAQGEPSENPVLSVQYTMLTAFQIARQ